MSFAQVKNGHISAYGEKRWNTFFQKFKNNYPKFPNTIFITTQIPIDLFLAFLDELTKEYYNSSPRVFWSFGEQGAQLSLSEKGHFNIYVKQKRKPEEFIHSFLPLIWNHYYDEGKDKFEIDGDILHIWVLELPKYHPYFELATMGFIKKALEIAGITVKKTTKIKSSAEEIYYQFVLDL